MCELTHTFMILFYYICLLNTSYCLNVSSSSLINLNLSPTPWTIDFGFTTAFMLSDNTSIGVNGTNGLVITNNGSRFIADFPGPIVYGTKCFTVEQWYIKLNTCVPGCPSQQFTAVPFCNLQCPVSTVGDGVCSIPCNVSSCNYDNGDCTSPASSIQASLLVWAWLLLLITQ